MENEALSRMAQDMQIKRYIGENQANYTGRVIYSAICHWMRYIVFDETTAIRDRKSKPYILSRGKELLNVMAEAFPESKSWIYNNMGKPTDADELIRNLRDKMLAAGELREVDESGNIGLPICTEQFITEEYDRIIGISDESGFEHMGVTRVIRKKTSSCNNEKSYDYRNRGKESQMSEDSDYISRNDISRNDISIDDYIGWLFNRTEWNECRSIKEFEFFDPFSKKPPYKSWTSSPSNRINNSLARLTIYNGLHEYYLMRKEQGKYWNIPMNAVLVEWKEERRVLLALRKIAGNMMQAAYEKKDSVYLLYFHCGLPIREQVLLDTYCWPLNSMMDKYSYVVPGFMWEEIKEIFTNSLGIELKEKINE